MSRLAIQGGAKVRSEPFPAYRTIGQEEKDAVTQVLDSGILSAYLGCWHDKFMGGPQIRDLEAEWATFFGTNHAIAVNSNTSGLIAAMGAIGLEPGDEVIVSPYSMTISASAPLFYGGIPVFADVEDQTFCLDPESVARAITPRTRAIIGVDIFGHPIQAGLLRELADKHDLYLIEDCAQAPGATLSDKYCGTLGHIGVFSLNYHKHIHCGEGGVVVTNDDGLAERLQLIRNHAEAVVEAKGVHDLTNMLGYNFRMTEMEAAVARSQLRKLPSLLKKRQENCHYLAEKLGEIPAITPPHIRPDATHAFYLQAFRFDSAEAGIDRNGFIDAVKAELPVMRLREEEGVLIGCGYVKPLYYQPLYQKQQAFGRDGYPFTLAQDHVSYTANLCPVVERLWREELFTLDLAHSDMTKRDLDDIAAAFHKVWEYRHQLQPALAA